MSADRELLELAAKAAGIKIQPFYRGNGLCIDGQRQPWNPLTDDGDALRLSAALKIDIEWQVTQLGADPTVEAYQSDVDGPSFCASENECDYRRAIVRAAAAIGKAMP